MLESNVLRRAFAVTAIAVTLTAAAAPNTAYARHGSGGAIALGVLGGLIAGAAIASSQPAYAAPPVYYEAAPAYYAPPPAYYYQPAPAYYTPAPTYYYQTGPYGYSYDGDYR